MGGYLIAKINMKNKVKTIGATALAAVAMVSMSFTCPETVNAQSQEITSLEAKEPSSVQSAAAITAITKVVGNIAVQATAVIAVQLTTSLVGGSASSDAKLDQESLNNSINLRLGELDNI